jgi:hypothetical protein
MERCFHRSTHDSAKTMLYYVRTPGWTQSVYCMVLLCHTGESAQRVLMFTTRPAQNDRSDDPSDVSIPEAQSYATHANGMTDNTPQSSLRSTTSASPILARTRLRLSEMDVMVTSPSSSSSSSWPKVAERAHARFLGLCSCLISTVRCLSRRRRTCSRSSSGVSSPGSRSSRGTGEASRSRIPSISRSPSKRVSDNEDFQ